MYFKLLRGCIKSSVLQNLKNKKATIHLADFISNTILLQKMLVETAVAGNRKSQKRDTVKKYYINTY